MKCKQINFHSIPQYVHAENQKNFPALMKTTQALPAIMIVHDSCGAVVPAVRKLGEYPGANDTHMVEPDASGVIISNYAHMFTVSQNPDNN